MDELRDELLDLRDDALDYVRLRWDSLRLEAVDRLSCAASRALGCILALTLLLGALMFMMFALALWLGELTGHLSLGFLISGGVLLVAGVVVHLLGRRMFAGRTVRYFVELFFIDNTYRHDARK
ncbi:MAG: phage holin family protein [Alistipes sp.]|nr:phage holin family protein [Alistipes sp.]